MCVFYETNVWENLMLSSYMQLFETVHQSNAVDCYKNLTAVYRL